MLSDMIGVTAPSSHTLVEAWEILQSLSRPTPATLAVVHAGNWQHPALQSRCPAIASCAARSDGASRRIFHVDADDLVEELDEENWKSSDNLIRIDLLDAGRPRCGRR